MYDIHQHDENARTLCCPISNGETQLFLVNRDGTLYTSLYKQPNPWFLAQKRLVSYFMDKAAPLDLQAKLIILPGTYHFGHIIGDLLDPILYLLKSKAYGDYKVLIVNAPQSIREIFDILGFSGRIYWLNVAAPVLIKSIHSLFAMPRQPSNLDRCAQMHASSGLMGLKIRNSWKDHGFSKHCLPNKVVLTSESCERIWDISLFTEMAKSLSWSIVNPLKTPSLELMVVIQNASSLIAENGSILMNCFLARSTPYYVLASERSRSETLSSQDFQGGGKYNAFHDGLIRYIYCDVKCASAKHPYSDCLYSLTKDVINLLKS